MPSSVGPRSWLDDATSLINNQAVQPLIDSAEQARQGVLNAAPAMPSFASGIPSLDALIGPKQGEQPPTDDTSGHEATPSAQTQPPPGVSMASALPSLQALTAPIQGAVESVTQPTTTTTPAPSAPSAPSTPSAMPTGQALPAQQVSAPIVGGNKDDFLRTASPYAQQVEQETGIPSRLILGVAANETGWGNPRYVIGNNYHGIHSQAGEPAITSTDHDAQGRQYTVGYRRFDSPLEGFRGFANFLTQNPRYAPALERYRQTGDVNQLAADITAAGYAEDPQYASKIQAIMAGIPDQAPGSRTSQTTPPQPVAPTQQQEARAPANGFGPGSYTPNQITAATNEGLDYETALAVCGPAAAIAFARRMGRTPTMSEALDLAKQVGWTAAQGMAGPASEQKLLQNMGVAAHLVDGAPDWGAVAADVQRGNPVIISTPGHYFVAEQYDPSTGKFNFGNSAAILRRAGGETWFTPQEMAALGMGPARASLFMDSPTSTAPSVVAGQSQPVAQAQSTGGPPWENTTASSGQETSSPTPSSTASMSSTAASTGSPDSSQAQPGDLMLRAPLGMPTSGADTTGSSTSPSTTTVPSSDMAPTWQDSQTEPASPPLSPSPGVPAPSSPTPPTDASSSGEGASEAGGVGAPPGPTFQDDYSQNGQVSPWTTSESGLSTSLSDYPIGSPGQTSTVSTPPTSTPMFQTIPNEDPTAYTNGTGAVQGPPAPTESPLKPVYDLLGNVQGYVHTGLDATESALNAAHLPNVVAPVRAAANAGAAAVGSMYRGDAGQTILDITDKQNADTKEMLTRQRAILDQADAWEEQNGTPDRTHGLRAVLDPAWRAANPELAAEWDDLNDKFNVAAGQASAPMEVAREAVPALQAARPAIQRGIEAVQGVASDIRSGLRSNAERVAAQDAERAGQPSVVAPGVFGPVPYESGTAGVAREAAQPHFVPPEVRERVSPNLEIPDDPTFAQAVANTGGQITDRGVELQVTRAQSPEAAGGTAGRGGVFMEPVKEGKSSTYAGKDMEGSPGGSQVLQPTLTAFRRPMVLDVTDGGDALNLGFQRLGVHTAPDPDRIAAAEQALASARERLAQVLPDAPPVRRGLFQGMVNRAEQDLSDAQAGRVLPNDVFIALADAKRATPPNSPARTDALVAAVERFGGNGDDARAFLATRPTMDEEQWGLMENILASEARRQGYDGIFTLDSHTPTMEDVQAHPEMIAARERLAAADAAVRRENRASASGQGSAEAYQAALRESQSAEEAIQQLQRDLSDPQPYVREIMDVQQGRNPTPGEPPGYTLRPEFGPSTTAAATAGPMASTGSRLATDVGNAALGSVLGATAGYGAPADTEEERRRHGIEGALAGGLAFPAGGRVLGRMGAGRAEGALQMAGPLPNLPPQIQQRVQAAIPRAQAQAQQRGVSAMDWLRTLGNSGIFGPASAAVNVGGAATNLALGVPKEFIRAASRGQPAEYAPMALATFRALPEMFAGAMKAALRSDPASISARATNPIAKGLGYAAERPASLLMGSPDAFFRPMFDSQGMYREAAQIATGNGLKGAAWWQAVEDGVQGAKMARNGQMPPNPQVAAQISNAGKAYANRQLFQGELNPGSFGKAVHDLANRDGLAGVIGSFLFPFTKTPYHMAMRTIENVPGSAAFPSLRGQQPTRFDAVYDQMFGAALAGGLLYTASQGRITGPGPSDSEKRQEMISQGWQPNSIVVGGRFDPNDASRGTVAQGAVYIPTRVLGQFQPILDAAGGVHDALAYEKPDKQLGKVLTNTLGSRGVVTNMVYLSGLANILSMMDSTDPASGLPRFLAQTAARYVPGAGVARAVATAEDPLQRQTSKASDVGFGEATRQVVAMSVPGALENVSPIGSREGLRPTLDVLGRPAANPQQGLAALGPKITTGQQDPVIGSFERAGIDISQPRTSITIAGTQVPLTPDEQDRYKTLRGDQLIRLVGPRAQSGSLERQPLAQQRLVLQTLLDTANATAEAKMTGELQNKAQRIRDAIESEKLKKAS